MRISKSRLPECLMIEPQVFADSRGSFFEQWNASRYRDAGIDATFVQSNVSESARGVLRGLHYQWPHPQGKLVSVIVGEVFDVAVDIRRQSPHFGKWVGMELSQENNKQMWVPPGFAHGFLVLSEHAEFLYKTTAYYAPQHERCIAWNDPLIAIDWPTLTESPVLSVKDQLGSSLEHAEIS